MVLDRAFALEINGNDGDALLPDPMIPVLPEPPTTTWMGRRIAQMTSRKTIGYLLLFSVIIFGCGAIMSWKSECMNSQVNSGCNQSVFKGGKAFVAMSIITTTIAAIAMCFEFCISRRDCLTRN